MTYHELGVLCTLAISTMTKEEEQDFLDYLLDYTESPVVNLDNHIDFFKGYFCARELL